MPDALSLRPTNRLIGPFLAWLKEHGGKKTQSDYLRDWLERGFSQWIMELAVTDPVLYARVISEADQLDAAAMERMAAQGQEALRALLVTLIEGIGGTVLPTPHSRPSGQFSGNDEDDDAGDGPGIAIDLDIGDDFMAID